MDVGVLVDGYDIVLVCVWIGVDESDLLSPVLALHCCVSFSLTPLHPHCPCVLHSFTLCVPTSQRCDYGRMLSWLMYNPLLSILFVCVILTCSASNVSTSILPHLLFLSFHLHSLIERNQILIHLHLCRYLYHHYHNYNFCLCNCCYYYYCYYY